MNVRKPADYSTIYRELTEILARNLPQMDEIYAIGKAISRRPEKGAAVAAAEFLQAKFPDRTGFSPRNVRRMRDFYKTYENDGPLRRLAMKTGWTLMKSLAPRFSAFIMRNLFFMTEAVRLAGSAHQP